jgi:GH25 family lysozyme M1 (1,4-beta-N-acetylmuramidase)
VQLAADNGSSSQRWKLVAKGTGKYIFYPACASASTAVLDVYGGEKKAGTNIQIYSYNGTAAQEFSINKISENTTTSQAPSNTTTLVGYDAYKGGRYGNSTGKVIYEGLDISSWQGGSFNFQNIKKAGYDYVILRCGTTKGKDTYFETNYKKAKAAGLDVGAYYYSYALNVSAAKSDAKNCLNWISGKKFEYPIYFDYEDPSQKSLSKTTAKNICLAFMDMVADKGYLVGMYTGHYKSTQIPTDEICAKYEFWVASYYNDGLHAPRDKSMAAISGMYQYTSSKRVNGVGPLDANVCYKDYPAIVKKYGFNGYTATGTN